MPGPVLRPKDRLAWVNQAINKPEVEALRRSVTRGTPFGSESCTAKAAAEMGLESTLRPRRRPRKGPGSSEPQ